MFNRRSDHFEKRKEQDIQLILKKKENGNLIRTKCKFNIVLQFGQNIG